LPHPFDDLDHPVTVIRPGALAPMAIHRLDQELEAAFDDELEPEELEELEELGELEDPEEPEVLDVPDVEDEDDLSELPEPEEASFFLGSEPPLSPPERESVR